jgi:hypothetical protein
MCLSYNEGGVRSKVSAGRLIHGLRCLMQQIPAA